MDTYSKHIDHDTFKAQRDNQLITIAQNLCIDHPEVIDEHAIREVIDDEVSLVNEHWDDYCSESIAKVSDIGEFEPADVYLEGTGEAIIRNVAWLSLSSNIEHYIKANIDKFRETRIIHNYLSAVVNGRHQPEHLQMDDCTPSTLLSDFSRYLSQDPADEYTTQYHDDYEPDFDDFNETHIRGLSVINPLNNGLRVYLLNWIDSLSAEDTDIKEVAETECEFKLSQIKNNQQ